MPPVRKRKGGRVTPKGTVAARPRTQGPDRPVAEPSARYTPPIPTEYRTSPPWVPVLMFALLLLGALMIILNYLDVLPGGTSNLYLLGGLVLILGGIIVATQYR